MISISFQGQATQQPTRLFLGSHRQRWGRCFRVFRTRVRPPSSAMSEKRDRVAKVCVCMCVCVGGGILAPLRLGGLPEEVGPCSVYSEWFPSCPVLPCGPMANQVCVHAHVHACCRSCVFWVCECPCGEQKDCPINERLQVAQYSVFVLWQPCPWSLSSNCTDLPVVLYICFPVKESPLWCQVVFLIPCFFLNSNLGLFQCFLLETK